MGLIKFEWDENKNLINQKKHKISFEEAQTVFFDTEALIIDDPEHSMNEDRFSILGLSRKTSKKSYFNRIKAILQIIGRCRYEGRI